MNENDEKQQEVVTPIRAKFTLHAIEHNSWNKDSRLLKFSAQYDNSIPEDRRFYDATPSGSFEMVCNNPIANAKFELGKAYYFDITPAD